jgi:hypothetical protein
MSQAEVDSADRFLVWKAKRRLAEIREADRKSDEHQLIFTSRMISSTLDPRVLLGRTELSKRGIMTRSATLFSELLSNLERVAGAGNRIAVPAIADAISRLTALSLSFGDVHIWVRARRWATCDRVVAALQNRDPDAEHYLHWFLTSELKVSPTLAPYVAAVLWTENGRRWRGWDESSLYPRIIRRARTRKYWDEQDAEWIAPQPNTLSLSEIRRLPEVVVDPFAVLDSIRMPIKLADLGQLGFETVIDERLIGLNLTRDEAKYFNLKKIYGLTQLKVREFLDWDPNTLERVKRSTDRKLKHASSRGRI